MPTILKSLPILDSTREIEKPSVIPLPLPGIDVNNPGNTSPHNQQFAAARQQDPGVKVTRTPGGIATSDGQIQTKNTAVGRNGILVTRTKGSIKDENGEVQVPAGKKRIDQSIKVVRTHVGLATNVNAGSQGFAAPVIEHAEKLPILGETEDRNSRPGGLPKNVMIR